MKIWNRFYFRISVVFLILIAFLAIMQARISSDVFERRRDEIDQRANAVLAADMAREIAPLPGTDAGSEDIGSAIHYMMVLNPKIEIYILDAGGAIRAYFADTETPVIAEKVAVDPIRTFMEGKEAFPIYGDDPRRPDRPSTFSAAALDPAAPETGYLYIILRSSRYDVARSEIADFYYNIALRRGLLFTLPLVAVLGLMIFFLLTKRLRSLTTVVRAFGEGDYRARAAESPFDEIGELAGSFNAMAKLISDNIEALTRAETNRRELVANISHDLKTPLAAIRGYAETLLEPDDNRSEAERRIFLETMLGAVETLGSRVDDLFRLSELENDNHRLKTESFSLAELCQDVIMRLSALAEKSGVRLILEPPRDLGLMTGDISQIERVLTNLIDNARRFAPTGSSVRVRMTRTDDFLRVTIDDDGPGLSEGEESRIFDRFYTGDPSRSSGHSGLGLAIAKRIVELHGGTIGAGNRSGGGARFQFSLPL